jgi:hypothetical protein
VWVCLTYRQNGSCRYLPPLCLRIVCCGIVHHFDRLVRHSHTFMGLLFLIRIDCRTTPSGRLTTQPTLQVVAHPLLMRGSPIHEFAPFYKLKLTACSAVFSSLAALRASHVRYVPWLPYPHLGVPALDPPSGLSLCGGLPVLQGYQLILEYDLDLLSFPSEFLFSRFLTRSCGEGGGNMSSIAFASYGTPTGVCGSYQRGSCHASNSSAIVESMCLGKSRCVINVPSVSPL